MGTRLREQARDWSGSCAELPITTIRRHALALAGSQHVRHGGWNAEPRSFTSLPC